jgi:plasmid stabilization system protein ParE
VRIEVLESARDDLISGRAFYETQRAGLGAYFLDSLFSDIESLLLFSGVHPIHFERYHRLLSKRFPFAIYYRTDGELIRIYAVLDCRQDPVRIADRLK